MKNLVTFLLIVIILSLAACGGDPAQQRAPQESSAGAADQAETAPEETEEDVEEMAAGDPALGREKFTATCASCHGPEGEGVAGLGEDMTTSDFIAEKSNDELVEFIKVGRDPSDPLNTTGVAMPVKGGNPALSDEDLQDIVAYIRTLQE